MNPLAVRSFIFFTGKNYTDIVIWSILKTTQLAFAWHDGTIGSFTIIERTTYRNFNLSIFVYHFSPPSSSSCIFFEVFS